MAIGKFISNHKLLCALTLGLAIPLHCIVKWLGRAITHIKDYFGTVAKTDKFFSEAELADLFQKEVVKGANKLLKKGIRGACNSERFNYLITQFFLLKANPQLEIEFHVHTSGTTAVPYSLSDSMEKKLCGLIRHPEDGFRHVKKMLTENKSREEQNAILEIEKKPLLPLISKLFIPFATNTWVGHGFLSVVEVDSLKNVNISIIDSKGDQSRYRSIENKLAKSIMRAFPTDYQISEVVHNKVIQQTDGYSCGFQQVANLMICENLDNVYAHVKESKFSSENRSLKGMERWFENELKPQIEEFLRVESLSL